MQIDVRIPTHNGPCLELSRWLVWLAGRTSVHDFNVDWHPNSHGPAEARNHCINEFSDADSDVLWFLDDDVVPPFNLDLLDVAMEGWVADPKAVYSGWYHQFRHDTGVFPCVYTSDSTKRLSILGEEMIVGCKKPQLRVDAVGAGCLLLPFQFLADGAQFEFGADGMGEDLNFCRTHCTDGVMLLPRMRCSHIKSVDLSELARKL